MIDIFERRKHNRLRGTLSAYIDGQVSQSEIRRVEEHLPICEECRSELDTLRGTVGLLRELPELAVPHSFTLAEAPARLRPVRGVAWTTRLATSAAALLLVALLLADITGIVTQTSDLEEETVTLQEAPLPAEKAVSPVEAPVAEAVPAPAAPGARAPTVVPAPALVAAVAPSPAPPPSPVPVEETAARGVGSPAVLAPPPPPAGRASAPPPVAATAPQVTPSPEESASVEKPIAPDLERTMSVASKAEVAEVRDAPEEARPLPGGLATPVAASPRTTEDAALSPVASPEAPPAPGVPSDEESVEALEPGGGLSLPLWQLEIAIAGLFVAFALLTLWMMRRRGRVPSR